MPADTLVGILSARRRTVCGGGLAGGSTGCMWRGTWRLQGEPTAKCPFLSTSIPAVACSALIRRKASCGDCCVALEARGCGCGCTVRSLSCRHGYVCGRVLLVWREGLCMHCVGKAMRPGFHGHGCVYFYTCERTSSCTNPLRHRNSKLNARSYTRMFT